jgi:SulP family sulfate permease
MGMANAAAGMSQAFPIGASGSRTAVTNQTGGRTQNVGLIAALTVGVVLLFLTAPVEYLPKAVLGAVIVIAALGLVDFDPWRALAAVGRAEVGIAAVTMVGVIVVGVLWGLGIALAITFIHASVRSSLPHDAVLGWVPRLGRYADASTHRTARVTPSILVYRLDDRVFFANADYVHGRILEAIDGATTRTRWFILDAEGVPSVDATGVAMFERLLTELDQRNISMAVARAKQPLIDQFDQVGLVARIGATNLHPNVEAAVHSCADRPSTG